MKRLGKSGIFTLQEEKGSPYLSNQVGLFFHANCLKITCHILCRFLRERRQEISYIACYAPDFRAALSKKNTADYR